MHSYRTRPIKRLCVYITGPLIFTHLRSSDRQTDFVMSSKVMTSQKWFFWNYGFYSIVQNNLSEKSSHAKYCLFSALFINASDLKFCPHSYSSCVYRMMRFKGSNGKLCKMMTSHFRTRFCGFIAILFLFFWASCTVHPSLIIIITIERKLSHHSAEGQQEHDSSFVSWLPVDPPLHIPSLELMVGGFPCKNRRPSRRADSHEEYIG